MSNCKAFGRFPNISKMEGYIFNKPFVKKFGNRDTVKYKIVVMSCVKNSLVEIDNVRVSEKGSVNDVKLAENISRAKRKIFEMSFCNDWDFFFTGTLDKKKFNRSDLEEFHKQFTLFIRDYNRSNKTNVKFLVVPELHSDGTSWHLHGFLSGVPLTDLVQFEIGCKMGKAIAEKVKNGDIVYNWIPYSKKFGFCDLEPIRNSEAVSKYITKYINKELASNVTELGAHLYYHSRGLKVAEDVPIKKDLNKLHLLKPNFKSDFCSIYWLSELEYNSLFCTPQI